MKLADGVAVAAGLMTGLVTVRLVDGQVIESRQISPDEADRLADRLIAAAAACRKSQGD